MQYKRFCEEKNSVNCIKTDFTAKECELYYLFSISETSPYQRFLHFQTSPYPKFLHSMISLHPKFLHVSTFSTSRMSLNQKFLLMTKFSPWTMSMASATNIRYVITVFRCRFYYFKQATIFLAAGVQIRKKFHKKEEEKLTKCLFKCVRVSRKGWNIRFSSFAILTHFATYGSRKNVNFTTVREGIPWKKNVYFEHCLN